MSKLTLFCYNRQSLEIELVIILNKVEYANFGISIVRYLFNKFVFLIKLLNKKERLIVMLDENRH